MINKRMNRRKFIKTGTAAGIGTAIHGFPHIRNAKLTRKTIILGIDGLDPHILSRFMANGIMPEFSKFAETHHFSKLLTTLPPQSPVAWSSFITGSNPGKSGIFDFVHRDPANFMPYLSTTRTTQPGRQINFGDWAIPLKGAKTEMLRQGRPFWDSLLEKDIPVTLHKLPANFPVEQGNARILSGMGTPDLLGSYGTYTLVCENCSQCESEATQAGGRILPVRVKDHQVTFDLSGPQNIYKTNEQFTSVRFVVNRDPVENLIRVQVSGRDRILKKGEWSDWIPLDFEMIPLLSSAHGMVRIYVQSVHPELRLYISPINIDPQKPDMPISSPNDYAGDLSNELGRFYTQGFPEDTKALSHGILSDEEFLEQGKHVLSERLAAYEFELNRFREGLFFFYFSSIDQNSHMLLRTLSPEHPLYDPHASHVVRNAMPYYYKTMDDVLAHTLDKIDSETRLIICSDHGFAPFTREFHLSTWLLENGFTAAADLKSLKETDFFNGVDWGNTKAYALGLNGIYLNLRGRERMGSLYPDATDRVLDDIIYRLSQLRDPKTGHKIIKRVYRSSDVFNGDYTHLAPDLIVGYESGYRISDEAAFGQFPEHFISDRRDKWSADHCMDPSVVPGVLLTNFELNQSNPALWDLAPTVLKSFGVRVPDQMDGKALI